MGDIVQFRSAVALAEQARPEPIAAQARYGGLDDAPRRRLMALADKFDRQQGFGWFFAEDREALTGRADGSEADATRECGGVATNLSVGFHKSNAREDCS